LKKQEDSSSKYHNQEVPSYGSHRYYSAAISSYRDFLKQNIGITNINEETEVEIHIRNNAAITGQKAERLFKSYAEKTLEWSVEDLTDQHGYGYDFLCRDRKNNEFSIEIKGCKEGIDSIRMTKNEWNTSKQKGLNYILYIVSNISSENPAFHRYENPYKLFKDIAEEKKVTSTTMHIKKKNLV